MPTFDFKCRSCNHQFEHLALPGAKQPLEIGCPSCNSKKVQKLLSAPNIQFKGSGFYVTDNKKSSVQKPAPNNKTKPDKAV